MNNWKKAIQKYSLESRNFSNANGLIVKDNFVGQRSNGFIGESRAEGGMGGDTFTFLNDGNKYYTVVIENTNTGGSAVTAIVFGANQYGINNDQPNAGVTVTVEESSHTQARAASQTQPFWVNGLRYFVETTAQLSNVITIYKKTSNGEVNSQIFRPLTFKTASQNQSLQIDAPGYKFPVDGDTQIQVPVNPSEQVTLVLQIGGRFNAANAINGQSALEVANQRELSTGLVQIVQG